MEAFGKFVGAIAGMFFSAWILMLVLGAVLGSFDLTTFGYWQSFGTVYLLDFVGGRFAKSSYQYNKAMDYLKVKRGAAKRV